MTGRTPEELKVGDMPDCLYHVWNWFLQLNSQRTSNGFGMNPITNQELWFFFQLERIEPESWELNLIRKFDAEVMEMSSKQQKKKQQSRDKNK